MPDKTKTTGVDGLSNTIPQTSSPGVGDGRLEISTGDDAAQFRETIQGVDLSRYQTEELRTSIAEILSVTSTVLYSLKVGGPIWLLGTIATTIALAQLEPWHAILGGVYAAVAFIFVSALVAFFFAARRGLRNLTRIVDVIFQSCSAVVDDLGEVRNRGLASSAVTLVSTVDSGVIAPVVEAVLHAQLGYFSKPLIWVYRSAFERLIAAIESALTREASKEQGLDEENHGVLDQVAGGTSRLREIICRYRVVALRTGQVVGFWALVPVAIVSIVGSLLLLAPLVAIFLFGT